ncbi:conserved hypothetical protein [Candidatus Desulfarcum epimagneticum]|uniref:Uncharacterized protein n=1 Tax=uncultured Desulfobacteraceae bacterium TaxID=218296 RepID=A0A484HCR6_9BACT|nr:conserved hypothetical protein [uncultured Desulfobacteraceae bacterium]
MAIQLNRDGLSQKARLLKAFDPGYVSAGDLSPEKLARLAKEYASKLNFFDLNHAKSGDWESFFDADPERVAACLKDPDAFFEKSEIPEKFGSPHYALFMAFLKLLRHPGKQFERLSQRHLDFYYEKVLGLERKEAAPDAVHVIFEAAPDAGDVLMEKGTLLDAGKDDQGLDLRYELDESILVNSGALSEIKTLFVHRPLVPIREIHSENARNEKDPAGFEKALRVVLGAPDPGDPFPLYPSGKKGDAPVDLNFLMGMFEKMISGKSDAEMEGYVRQCLHFPGLDDFKACMAVAVKARDAFKENGLFDAKQWDGAYRRLEKAHRNRMDADRMAELKNERQNPAHPDANIAFDALMRLALGDPDPGKSLPSMPAADFAELEKKAGKDDLGALIYIREKLFMGKDDFLALMEIHRDSSAKAGDARWQKGYEILERARRKKRDFVYPDMGRKETIGIYPGEIPASPPGDQSKFKAFGSAPAAGKSESSWLPAFAVSSPVLAAESGERTLVLSVICKAGSWDPGEVSGMLSRGVDIFEAFVMSGGSRVDPDSVKVSADSRGLRFELSLSAQSPALSPGKAGDTDYFEGALWPFVVVRLKEIPAGSGDIAKRIHYDLFSGAVVEKIAIEARVRGLSGLLFKNAAGIPDPKKGAFTLFGKSPKKGDGFFLAHPELSRSRLTRLAFHFDWDGLPGDFQSHYRVYDQAVPGSGRKNEDFKASLKVWSQKRLMTLDDGSKALFAASESGGLARESEMAFSAFDDLIYYKPDPSETGALKNPLDWSLYFKLEFDGPDFLHELYPGALAWASAQSADPRKVPKVPSPYEPLLAALSVDYTAAAETDFTKSAAGKKEVALSRLHPFGFSSAGGERPALFPRFEDEGSLFIGIQELKTPADISILFELSPAAFYEDVPAPDIEWSYLKDSGWKAFEPVEILKDATSGLMNTGIVSLTLPETAGTNNPALPEGVRWIRASAAQNTRAVSDIIELAPQAAKAVFKNMSGSEGAPDAAQNPPGILAAGSIQAAADPHPAIASVRQPHSSFGGRAKENRTGFHKRISERLRHKNRAVSPRDYESLVLEKFPEIYKAKCLRKGELNDSGKVDVTLVVVPDISGSSPFFPLEPKAPFYLLNEIEKYLKSAASPFVNISVKNPRYEQITYRFAVRFLKEYNQGYYLKRLNEDVIRFLSPWAYTGEADLGFGTSIENASVVNFMEGLHYVDYVANLKLFNQVDPGAGSSIAPGDEFDFGVSLSSKKYAAVTRPDAILVSATGHMIDHIYTEYYEPSLYEGIGYLILGLDFIIGILDREEDPSLYDYEGMGSKDFREKGLGHVLVGRNLVIWPDDRKEDMSVYDYDGVGSKDFHDRGLGHMMTGRNFVVRPDEKEEVPMDRRDPGVGDVTIGSDFILQ